jgi:hypothetical protein
MPVRLSLNTYNSGSHGLNDALVTCIMRGVNRDGAIFKLAQFKRSSSSISTLRSNCHPIFSLTILDLSLTVADSRN